MKKNLEMLEFLNKKAEEFGCSSSQLAIAWVMAKKDFIVPIPGTKRITYLENNIGASNIKIDSKTVKELDEVFNTGKISGARYTKEGMVCINS